MTAWILRRIYFHRARILAWHLDLFGFAATVDYGHARGWLAAHDDRSMTLAYVRWDRVHR